MKSRTIPPTVFCFAAMLPCLATAASFRSLGHLPGGGSETSARGVSSDGSVVLGGSSRQAFRWTAETGMVGLGILPGRLNSNATAVSNDGSVIVGDTEDLSEESREAFRWTAETGVVTLGFLPGGDSSRASAVSADGSVIEPRPGISRDD